jgi:hypothetical protein
VTRSQVSSIKTKHQVPLLCRIWKTCLLNLRVFFFFGGVGGREVRGLLSLPPSLFFWAFPPPPLFFLRKAGVGGKHGAPCVFLLSFWIFCSPGAVGQTGPNRMFFTLVPKEEETKKKEKKSSCSASVWRPDRERREWLAWGATDDRDNSTICAPRFPLKRTTLFFCLDSVRYGKAFGSSPSLKLYRQVL